MRLLDRPVGEYQTELSEMTRLRQGYGAAGEWRMTKFESGWRALPSGWVLLIVGGMNETDPSKLVTGKRASAANPADVDSIDSIITAAYDGISGPAGQKRDWDRERSLYFPGARLIPTAKAGGDDDLAPQILDVDGFIARVEPFFEKSGFYEKEIARRTEQFGRLAQVWSTYESRHDPADPEPFMRGINSIQLFNDGNRWWIVNIYWQQESDEHPIPERYLLNDE